MENLESLYQSVEKLEKLGVGINQELLDEIDRVEEELIKNEIIPSLSQSIEPIIRKIQRPIVLVIDYDPNNKFSIRMTREKVLTDDEYTKEYTISPKEILKAEDNSNDLDSTRVYSPKSPWTGLMVRFPNGKTINKRYAYETFIRTIEEIGIDKVKSLGIILNHTDLITKKKSPDYNQHKVKGGYLIFTHTSTDKKKKVLEEISNRLNIGLEVEIVG